MSKADILKRNDTKVIPFEVEEWETTIHLRTLKGNERAFLLQKIHELEKKGREVEAETWIVLLCASEPNGQRLFSDDDFKELNEKNGDVLHKIAMVAARHSGLSAAANDDAKKG